MALHKAEFEYKLQEWGNIEMDVDVDLDFAEKEEILLREIKEVYPDIEDINITSVTVL